MKCGIQGTIAPPRSGVLESPAASPDPGTRQEATAEIRLPTRALIPQLLNSVTGRP